jgi:photosystem II stability/assembly factor-like uncharacterized protein
MTKPTLLILAVGLTLSPLASPVRAATWRSIGPDGGSVEALAFAPSDPQIAYTGTYGGGVFRSGDGGSSWTAASNGLGNALFVSSLAVDPRDSRIVYAGTIGGLFETTSGGASWTLLPLRISGYPPSVNLIRIDPTHPRILYAVTNSGIFRTADGGAHWTQRDAGLPAAVTALDLDPDHPGTLYAAVFDSREPSLMPRLYKTADGGGSWTVLPGLQAFYISGLARSTGTLYAAADGGLFATRDGGATWTHRARRDDLYQVVAAPSGTLYGNVFFRVLSSTDGGRTWNEPAPLLPGQLYGQINALALDPSGRRLLAGFVSTGIFALDAGAGWTRASLGLRATEIRDLAVSSSTASPRLDAATFGEGVFVSDDGGASFSARNSGLPFQFSSTEIDVFSLAANPKAPGSLAAGLFDGAVAHTSDAGRHWDSELPICRLPVDRLAIAAPATIFAAASYTFFGSRCSEPVDCTAKVSRDGGASFACLDGPKDVSAFLVDPLQPANVYAAAGDAIWKSTDGGEHFTLVASGLGVTITTLASSPAAHQTLYAGSDFGALKSIDGGAHWRGLTLSGVTRAVVADPSNPSLVYASSFLARQSGGASEAVFVSRDGGATWSVLGDGLPFTSSIHGLALDPVRHVLYAGTQGSGVWALSLP